jgi:hypothetical protein
MKKNGGSNASVLFLAEARVANGNTDRSGRVSDDNFSGVCQLLADFCVRSIFVRTLQQLDVETCGSGFAWRPGSASFKTPSESGTHNLELLFDGKETPVSPNAIRIVEVPFLVPDSGPIEV